ncbi:MAG: heme-binding protein [Gammaproteobacteria bacterium]|nr:heme-binding protein [Gammaproteobacteria bacterium]
MKKFTIMLALTLAGVMPAAAEQALIGFRVLSPETALELARASLADCRKRGYQVAVAVVDRFGVAQVVLRDRFAGPHTPETARRKAWTAVSFRTDTLTMAEETQAGKPQSGARRITDALMIGGGVPVEAGGSIVGGIGISGAPGGEADDACARAGIEAIAGKIAF